MTHPTYNVHMAVGRRDWIADVADAIRWASKHIGPEGDPPEGAWAYQGRGLFTFRDGQDAMLFKLTWGGQ